MWAFVSIIILILVQFSLSWTIGHLVKHIRYLNAEGLRLQNAAIENDLALRQGLDEQLEIHEGELLDAAQVLQEHIERIDELETKLVEAVHEVTNLRQLADMRILEIEALRVANRNLEGSVLTLEERLQYRMPVLAHMRKEVSDGDGS